ncbi:Uncharacterized protein T4C_5859 [Trichinella pseudospiralis]|uniref:RNA-directed DNA polymerase n=1 Tax=Trichinella pseudospiralis TaxID=6337 RepID=A0A0V1JIQ4_TRIPS|nr:Uncharacterized protein T4C_5859 [Trichinella pseudospiralis]
MLGYIEEFDISKPKEWTAYASRLTFFLEANNVTDSAKRRAVLLSSCGGAVFNLIQALISPANPNEKFFDEILASAKRDQSGMSSRKIRVTVVIENFPCEMEIDTGSEYTVLFEYVFRKLSQGIKIRLEPITVKLATFQGELVKVKGSCSVNVPYGNIHRTLALIVAKGHCPNVLRLNWFESLGILSGVHRLTSTPPQISEVLRKYRSVFTEELGMYVGKPVSLDLDPNVTPICMKARKVPFALREKIDAELDKLVEQGVLEPVDHPVWSTPIVTPVKPDGTVRICGDYKCTINKALRKHAYPIPAVNQLLASLSGGKVFAKLDLAQAYQQLTIANHCWALFVPKKKTLQSLSPRMLRWLIFLNAYDYVINYRPDKEIANADALSRLPKQSTENNDPQNSVILLLETIDNFPLHSKDIARITAKDPILTRILSWAWRGWPKSVSDERLKPYVTRQHEISIHNGCLLWSSRVIIPLQARHKILKELHIGHSGIEQMKALARSYVWWPKMDSEIENLVRKCELCQQSRASPPHAPVHKWESPRIPWTRIHVNLAGPIYGKNFLIVVDSFSKWLEVRQLKNTTSESVISCLRQIFSIHGLPDIIGSDNGTQFTSHTFQEYLNKGGIRHITSAPFHPFSNGEAERMVRSTKEFIKKMTQRDWEYNLANFLFCQHVTPSTTTGKSPAELLMNRRLRTDYNQTSYRVTHTEDGQLWRRHIDQLRKRYVTTEQNHSAEKDESQEDETAERTVEAIPEEHTAVATTPREETAAASSSPAIVFTSPVSMRSCFPRSLWCALFSLCVRYLSFSYTTSMVLASAVGGLLESKHFDSTNYSGRKFAMKNYLVDGSLWHCVENENADHGLNQRALAEINLSIKPCASGNVRKDVTAKQAWRKLRCVYEDNGLVSRIGLYSSLFKT